MPELTLEVIAELKRIEREGTVIPVLDDGGNTYSLTTLLRRHLPALLDAAEAHLAARAKDEGGISPGRHLLRR